jgi:hypothetical protein
MSREQLEKIFEKDSSKWEGDNAIKGLLIISEYISPQKETILRGADHDIIYSVSVDEILTAGLDYADAEALRALNWMISDDYLACFV